MISSELKRKIASTDYTMNKGRYQTRDGKVYSRVTSVLGMIKFDEGFLETWRKKMAINDFSKRIDIRGTYKGAQIFDEFSAAMNAADVYTSNSATFGTKVHECIEKYMLTGVFPEPPKDDYADVSLCLKSVQKFLLDFDISPKTVEVVKPELFVYSKLYGYAGSADFVCMRGNDTYLFDWKTSNSYRIQYALQLAAYAKAIEELYGLHIKKGNCIVFGKDHVGYEPHSYTDKELDYYFELFKACLTMHNFVKNIPIPYMTIKMEQ